MKIQHRGKTIELSLIGFHHPNYPYKMWDEAKPIWKIAINGKENSGTRTGNWDKVLASIKTTIDWLIDDPGMKNIF